MNGKQVTFKPGRRLRKVNRNRLQGGGAKRGCWGEKAKFRVMGLKKKKGRNTLGKPEARGACWGISFHLHSLRVHCRASLSPAPK